VTSTYSLIDRGGKALVPELISGIWRNKNRAEDVYSKTIVKNSIVQIAGEGISAEPGLL